MATMIHHRPAKRWTTDGSRYHLPLVAHTREARRLATLDFEPGVHVVDDAFDAWLTKWLDEHAPR
jgi:hypothetical protein